MRIGWLLYILLLIGVGCTPKITEKTVNSAPPKKVETVNSTKDTLSFPESWVGEWTGELEIWKGSTVVQKLPMNMSIVPIENSGDFHWKTTFGDQAETTKPYLLKTTDKDKGLYVIDEQNSIIIESYLFDQKLVSWYVVMENLILATFEKQGDQIVFEILAGSEKPVSVTGGEKVGEDEIPEVKTMPFSVMQRAFLSRK